jgi:TnpA family transposase
VTGSLDSPLPITERQLASYPRQNGVAAALRELGHMERTLFTLGWIDDPEPGSVRIGANVTSFET